MQTIFRGGSFGQTALGDEIFPGSYFMQVVNPTSMVLEAKVNQADSQKIRVGAKADVRLDAYPDKLWPGRVASIAAMAGGGGGDGRSRTGSGDYVREITVVVDILESSVLIIPDLSASADIYLQRHENVVIAPREALEREGEGWFVRVRTATENAFERRRVELGSGTDTHVAVASGLKEGDVVALELPPPPR
jgi:HlyD family secretion protein